MVSASGSPALRSLGVGPLKVPAWASGISFGLTSGVITTLGLIVGLRSGTGSRLAVIGGIVTIAVADAFSDALGIHISEEGRGEAGPGHIWAVTLSTFLSKLVIAFTFIVPVLVLSLGTAVWVSVAWGGVVLVALSWAIARSNEEKVLPVVGEHLLIATLVIVAAQFLGNWVAATFN
jgi:VIT1/CCC1 family predicted Fe2+/Mn2+ transporter